MVYKMENYFNQLNAINVSDKIEAEIQKLQNDLEQLKNG